MEYTSSGNISLRRFIGIYHKAQTLELVTGFKQCLSVSFGTVSILEKESYRYSVNTIQIIVYQDATKFVIEDCYRFSLKMLNTP